MSHHHADHCVLCGQYSPACDDDNLCPACIDRYQLGDEAKRDHVVLATDYHQDADWGPTKAALDLAERVRNEVQPWHTVAYKHGLSIEVVDHIISSALACIARDIRQGNVTPVEYLGEFNLVNGWIHYRADPELLQIIEYGVDGSFENPGDSQEAA